MEYLRIPRDNYDKLLDKDPKLIQMDITDFIKYLRSKNLSYATISSYVSAINKFYNMNDIINLNWKKIRSFLGEHEPAVASIQTDPSKEVEIRHTPPIRGGFAELQRKGLKILDYRTTEKE
jgi:hypothetical protein